MSALGSVLKSQSRHWRVICPIILADGTYQEGVSYAGHAFLRFVPHQSHGPGVLWYLHSHHRLEHLQKARPMASWAVCSPMRPPLISPMPGSKVDGPITMCLYMLSLGNDGHRHRSTRAMPGVFPICTTAGACSTSGKSTPSSSKTGRPPWPNARWRTLQRRAPS